MKQEIDQKQEIACAIHVNVENILTICQEMLWWPVQFQINDHRSWPIHCCPSELKQKIEAWLNNSLNYGVLLTYEFLALTKICFGGKKFYVMTYNIAN